MRLGSKAGRGRNGHKANTQGMSHDMELENMHQLDKQRELGTM